MTSWILATWRNLAFISAFLRGVAFTTGYCNIENQIFQLPSFKFGEFNYPVLLERRYSLINFIKIFNKINNKIIYNIQVRGCDIHEFYAYKCTE